MRRPHGDLLDRDHLEPERLVRRLAAARIGGTFNQYREGPRARLLRARLRAYLEERWTARVLLVGEAPGYRGARLSGIPFTSERHLTGAGPGEATATIVQGALADLGATGDVLLWNAVPTHPGTPIANRAPTAAEIAASAPFLALLAHGRVVLPVGRVAERACGLPGLRHPARGGATAFRAGLADVLERLSDGTVAPGVRDPDGTATMHPRPVTDRRLLMR